MNSINCTLMDDDARFDRLVDGELSTDEYRQLIASLDDEPGGWRRCATAFLEAQAWGREFRGVRREMEIPPVAAAAPGSHYRWTNWLAMAASMLIMFGIGMVYQQQYGRLNGVASLSLPTSPTSPTSPTVLQKVDADAMAAQAGRFEGNGRSLAPVENLRLVVTDEHGGGRPVDVPLYDANRVGLNALVHDGDVLPKSVLDAFRRSGFQVQRYQRFMPVELEDGRQAVVPMDGYQIVPVGMHRY